MLSTYKLETIGISNRSEMMKLRIECVKCGTSKPNRIHENSIGPPLFSIPRSTLENLIDNGFQISDIAKLLQISKSTVYRIMAQFGLSKRTFSQINNDELDGITGVIIKDHPMCGENTLPQMLIAKDIRIQRWRLRDSECVHRIDQYGIQTRKTGRLAA